MPRRAGTVTVNFDAGTATFLKDVELAAGTVREFGRTTQSSMAGARTSMVSASTALKELGGNFTGSSRAVARLLVDVGGLGPVLSAAFPIIGGLAFIGMIVKMGEAVNKFFKDMAEAPKRMTDAFRPLQQSTLEAADNLRVVNDRLEMDIAKLEGKRQNSLKLALDEAVKSADALGQSLEKDLKTASDLLEKNKTGWIEKNVFGKEGTEPVQKINEELRRKIHEQDEILRTAARKAEINPDKSAATKDLKDATDARNKAVKQYLEDAEKAVSAIIDWKPKAKVSKATGVWKDVGSPLGGLDMPDKNKRDNALAAANAMREQYQNDQDRLREEMKNEVLVPKKAGLEAEKANEELFKPFHDRVEAMGAQLTALREKMFAVGQPQWIKDFAKSEGDATKIIAQINKELESHHTKLSDVDEALIRHISTETTATETEDTWREHVDTTNKNMNERIKLLDLTNAAIGKGVDEARKLHQATEVAKFWQGHEGDTSFMNAPVRQAEAELVAKKAGDEFDKEHLKTILETTDKLNDQIKVEQAVAGVINQGSAAVRRKQLEMKIALMVEHDHTQAMKDETEAMRKQFEIQEKTGTAEEIDKLREQRIAIEAVTGAVLQGAEAMRKAGEKAHYAEMERAGQAGAVPEQKALDEARHQQEILVGATRIVMEHKNRLEVIEQEIAKVEELKRQYGNSLALQISMRDLENQRLDAWSKLSLAIGTAKSGLAAFVYEMESSIKTAGQVVYDTLHDATQKFGDEITKLLTGQKFSFGKMAQDVGGSIMHTVVQEAIKRGIEELHKKLPGLTGKPPAVPKVPGSTADNPIFTAPGRGVPSGTPNDPVWVAIANQNYTPVPGAASRSAPNTLQSIGQVVGTLGQVMSKIPNNTPVPRQGGGPVSPGGAYIVGEHGPEPFLPQVSGHVMSNTMAQKTFGSGGSTYFMSVDARGTDPVLTEQRVYRAIKQAHQDAIGTSVRASVMRNDRVPAGR